jgi:hypothetical protein
MRVMKIFAFAILPLVLAACNLSFGYKPPAIPLSVSIDTQGTITFSVEQEVKLPTPIGTFSVGMVVDPAEYFGVNNTLTIRYNGEDNFYDLHGRDFDLRFESGHYKQINLRKTGTNLLLEIEKYDVFTSCYIPVHGTYNYSRSEVIMNFGPGLNIFYDQPGDGAYSNDQAGCEINQDCTQLRAFNRDSADSNVKGVTGSWVDEKSGISTAQWSEFIVECEWKQ